MRGRVPAHLHEVIRDRSQADEEEYGLPAQADGEYEPYGRAAHKPLVSLHLITPDGKVHSFQYRHLDSDSRFEHQKIVLRFLGYCPTMIVIEGHHLWQLYDYIHQDRMPWVMQAARDFPEKDKPFVSKITVIDLIESK
jgi:hypothetical protein